MNHISLFSGIGGFDLASEWMGWRNILSCEIADFPNRILEHYWPDAYHHRDIHTLNIQVIEKEITSRFGVDWRSGGVILTGGFPCQPFSAAGKRKGTEDSRHLWPEMLRVIREVRPDYIVGENVAGLVNWSGGMVFEQVFIDLENEGYEVGAFMVPACATGAPHRRDRIWFVAYSVRNGRRKRGECKHDEMCEREICQNVKNNRTEIRCELGHGGNDRTTTDTASFRQSSEEHREIKSGRTAKKSVPNDWQNFPTQPPICSGDDGIPPQLDGITFPKWRNESIKAYGNAVVPQVVYEFFKMIEAHKKGVGE